jgi:diguanylate cyclase (GGDEF)-like protein/PAS domain S-box-containing protein
MNCPWYNAEEREYIGILKLSNGEFMGTEMCEQVIDNLYEGIYFVNMEKKITYWSKGAERITGYSADDVVGARCSDNILRHVDEDGNELCEMGCPLKAAIEDQIILDENVYLHHKKGYRLPVRVRVVPLYDDTGTISGAAEIFQDVSKRGDLIKELEKLKKEVLLDGLTGVGNRRLADMALQESMSGLNNKKIPVGVVFLDVDNFKMCNDIYGHKVGDRVLVMVAKTISNLSRPPDTVARWGGEEFIIVVPDISFEILQGIAERARSFVENTWLIVDGEKVQVTISVGATMAQAGESEEELIERVDDLMYESKRGGKNMVTVK